MMDIINMLERWSGITPSKKKTAQYYAVIDTQWLKAGLAPNEVKPVQRGILGKVLESFESRKEAEKFAATGKDRRVVPTTSKLAKNRWVGVGDVAADPVGCLPPR